MTIYVVFGVDGVLDVPRAWFKTRKSALFYKYLSGEQGLYMTIRRMEEGDFQP